MLRNYELEDVIFNSPTLGYEVSLHLNLKEFEPPSKGRSDEPPHEGFCEFEILDAIGEDGFSVSHDDLLSLEADRDQIEELIFQHMKDRQK